MHEDKKRQTIIICINSVKGGAGKTTIALSLACTLIRNLEAAFDNQMTEQAKKIQEPQICFIDLDIMGTGAKYTIYGETSNGTEDIKYLNDINNDEDYNKLVNRFSMKNIKYEIDCLLMNDDPREKGKFINNVRIHTSKVNIDIFLSKTKRVIEKIVKSGKYNYIIIDCAPSYESCAQNIYDYLAREIKPNYKEVKCIYNLFISTFDRAHVMNTISSVYKITNSTQDNSNVKIVLNDILNSFEEDEKETMKNDLRSKVYEKYTDLRKKEIKDCGDTHQPSDSTLKIEDIIVKRYSEFGKKVFFGHGKQIDGTDLWEDLQDSNFVKALGIDIV